MFGFIRNSFHRELLRCCMSPVLVGPFKILNKLNCNAYVIDFLRDYAISCTFNINDLVNYKSFDCSPLVVKPSPKPLSKRLPLTSPRYSSHYHRED